jgi:hypothetical protein
MDAQLRSIISNPTGDAFKDKYLPLGKVQGKKQLRTDCARLNMRIPIKGMSIIEMGYSRRNKTTWANDQSRSDYDPGSLAFGGTNTSTARRVGKGKNDSSCQVQPDGSIVDNWGRTISRVSPITVEDNSPIDPVPEIPIPPLNRGSNKPPLILGNVHRVTPEHLSDDNTAW